jgi:hypothetical protein
MPKNIGQTPDELVQDFEVKDALKPGGDIKKALPGIIGDATDDNEKLKRIYDFCRTKIKNITFDPSISDEERAKIKFNGSPSDTLKKLQGRSLEIRPYA